MIEREGKKTFASEARHYITIQSLVRVHDYEGGEEATYIDEKQVAAVISPIQARQQFNYKSVGVDATHLIKVRGLIDITEKNRIKFGTRLFEILTIEDIQELGVLKVCTCKEVR